MNLQPNEFLKIYRDPSSGAIAFEIVGYLPALPPHPWMDSKTYSIKEMVTPFRMEGTINLESLVGSILFSLAGVLDRFKLEKFGVRYQWPT